MFTVFARTSSEPHGKLTAFIVERAWGGGREAGRRRTRWASARRRRRRSRFDNVRVPAEAVLGGEGQGFKVAMSILNNGRTGLGGGSVGGMKRCIALARPRTRATGSSSARAHRRVRARAGEARPDGRELLRDGIDSRSSSGTTSIAGCRRLLRRGGDSGRCTRRRRSGTARFHDALQIAGGNRLHEALPVRARRAGLAY